MTANRCGCENCKPSDDGGCLRASMQLLLWSMAFLGAVGSCTDDTQRDAIRALTARVAELEAGRK